MAVARPDFPFFEFGKSCEMVVMTAKCRELCLLQCAFESDRHTETARAGETTEIIGTGKTLDGGHAVELDEIATGFGGL